MVYMTQTDGNSESTAIGSNSPALFTFRPAQRTWSRLGQLRDRITHDLATLRGQGVDPTAWGPDVDLNTVTASVGTNASAAQQVFDASYGLGAVYVVVGDGAIRPAASRLNDSAPWNGGDYIADDGQTDCSAGPPVTDSAGSLYMLTAGHCFRVGNRVLQGSHSVSGDHPTVVGNVTSQEEGSGYDYALVPASTSTLDFRTSTPNVDGSAHQYGSAGSVVGQPACASGAFSGERCGTVTQVNQTITLSNGDLDIHMQIVRNPGVPLAGPGDSGGPVYGVHISGLQVQGMIIAVSGTPYQCPNGDPGGRGVICTDTVYFSDVTSLLAHAHLILHT